MIRSLRLLSACLLSLGAVGCNVALPNWSSPGDAATQRARAHVYDPYPRNDGGPRIDGGRPLSYDQPLDEVAYARQYDDSNGQSAKFFQNQPIRNGE